MYMIAENRKESTLRVRSFYSGQPPLNRLSFKRQSHEALNQHLESPEARFILFK